MSSRVEDLQALARMLDEGKISEAEYETVKAELIAAPASDWETEEEPGEVVAPDPDPVPVATEEPVEAGEGATETVPVEADASADDPPPGEGSLLDTIKAMPRTYLYAAGVALVVLFAGLVLFGGSNPPPVAASGNTVASPPEEPPVDSLGIRFDALRDDWNALDLDPMIRSGISVTPEPGPLDGFLHRFDSASVLAGAYHPTDGYIRALMLRSGLFHPDLGNLYIRLCHLLHPNDQGCLDTYIGETGVYGATAADFADADLEVSWFYQANRWSFTLADNVQTIRVQAPGQS